MKRNFRSLIALVLLCAMALMMVSCSSDFEEFDGDMRDKYNFNLKDYVDEGDYKDIEIVVGSAEPSREEIDAQILEWRVLYTATVAEWKYADKNTAAKIGDIVEVRYQGYLDGEKLADIAHSPYKEEGYSTTLGTDRILKGVDEKIVGMKPGEKKTVEITVPDPCFNYPYYVGKTITIDLELTGIRTAELAPYDEEFTSYYSCHTIEDFESYVISELKRQRSEALENYVLDRVMSKIYDNFEIEDYPEEELQATIDYIKDMDKQAAKDGTTSVEEYIKSNYSMTMDEYNENVESYAKDLLQMEMVLYYIGRNEQIGLTNAAFDEKASEMAVDYDLSTPAELVSYLGAQGYSEADVREMVWFELIYDFIYENTTQVEK